jgi:hypothetical protein
VTVESPPVRVPALREVAWRIRPAEPGRYQLTVSAGGDGVAKELRVGGSWGPTSALRTGAGVWTMLLYPGEEPIDSDVVESVEVLYGQLELSVLGWPIHWVVLFFVLSVASGFAFRRVLGVEI